MKILKFSFSAPLQSWGEDVRFDFRSTAVRPTKSGIIGFLGCCLGYPRGDERLNRLNEQLSVAIRTDRPGEILTDFHTVQGTDGVILSAEGKKRSGGSTIITPKQYLQDAWFTVFLRGEDSIMDTCFHAVIDPVWTPYLGRKNCIPSVPVIPEWVEANTLEEAVCQFSPKDPVQQNQRVTVEMDLQTEDEQQANERVYMRNDSVLHSERNEYRPRRVKSYTIQAGGDASCI